MLSILKFFFEHVIFLVDEYSNIFLIIKTFLTFFQIEFGFMKPLFI